MTDSLFSEYLFDIKKYDLISYNKNKIIPMSQVDACDIDIFVFLSSKNVEAVYFDILSSSDKTYEINLLMCRMKTNSFLKEMEDKVSSYFGIYEKTKNISSIFLFIGNDFIELSSGTLEGDDLIVVIAEELSMRFKDVRRYDFLCNVDYEYGDDEDMIN